MGWNGLLCFIQDINNVFAINWVDEINYGIINRQAEVEHSAYNFAEADTNNLLQLFEIYEKEAKNIINKDLVLPAYDYTLKCSHVFNLLDARGAISVAERTGFIGRVRRLARECARKYINRREELGFPLLKEGDGNE